MEYNDTLDHNLLMRNDWVIIADLECEDNNFACQITEVREDGIKVEEFEDIFRDEYLRPIRLTEEILRKNGFYYDIDKKAFLMGNLFQIKRNVFGFEINISHYPFNIYAVHHL